MKIVILVPIALLSFVSPAEAQAVSAEKWLEWYDSGNSELNTGAVTYYMGVLNGIQMSFVCDGPDSDETSYRTMASEVADIIRAEKRRGGLKTGVLGELRSYVLTQHAKRVIDDPSCKDASWLQRLRDKSGVGGKEKK